MALSLVAQGAVVHAAALVNSPSGIAGPAQVISFNELGNLQNQAILNQYASFGASFGNAWWDSSTLGQAGSSGFSGGSLVSGATAGTIGPGGITFFFTTAVSDAAAAMVDQGGSFSISSFS